MTGVAKESRRATATIAVATHRETHRVTVVNSDHPPRDFSRDPRSGTRDLKSPSPSASAAQDRLIRLYSVSALVRSKPALLFPV
ncbi:unnamed protein product [Allacma fusca]|uniref:Uncharacterized protein n=1 Tax=Allacma fusca TaxID=39272 RepID=A0A8J2KA81_9HEXA|nr:unnamed protein product [Allacma fusca]